MGEPPRRRLFLALFALGFFQLGRLQPVIRALPSVESCRDGERRAGVLRLRMVDAEMIRVSGWWRGPRRAGLRSDFERRRLRDRQTCHPGRPESDDSVSTRPQVLIEKEQLMSQKLTGKVAIVTGASKGIGA